MAFVVVLVVAAGLIAAGLYLQISGRPSTAEVVTAPTPCSTGAPAPLDPRRVKVNVYNATGRAGLAASTANGLRARRFVVGAVANDPAKAKVTGTALVRYGGKGSRAATLVGSQVRGARLAKDKRAGADIDLVLGAGFTTLAPPAKGLPAKSGACTPTSR